MDFRGIESCKLHKIRMILGIAEIQNRASLPRQRRVMNFEAQSD